MSGRKKDTGKTVGFVLRVTPSVTNRHPNATPYTTCRACIGCHYRHSVRVELGRWLV